MEAAKTALSWDDMRALAKALTAEQRESVGMDVESAASAHDTQIRRRLDGKAPPRFTRFVQAYPWVALELAAAVSMLVGLLIGTLVGRASAGRSRDDRADSGSS